MEEQPQALLWAAKNPNTNRPFGEAQMDPHFSNPVTSWRVVVQQPVEEVHAEGVRPEAGSSHPSSQKPWTGEDVHALYPGGGRRETGKIQVGGVSDTLSHPPTPPWEPGRTSVAKVVVLNDLSVPEGRIVPKGKYQLAAGLGMALFRHLPGPGGWIR